MLDDFLKGTWVHIGDGNVINIDTHIDHLNGTMPVDMSDTETKSRFNWAVLKLLEELKRRVEKDREE